MRFSLYIFLLICLPFITMAQDFDLKPNATLPLNPDVKKGQLKNGLTYYLQKNTKPENRIELRLAIKAGSLQEDNDQLGIAHFVEHMAFNGSKHFAKNDLIKYLESTGMRFGADLNAYTSFEETVYMLQARTDSSTYLNKALLILEDWASGIRFDSLEIEKERGVIISEWRTRLSAKQRLQNKYLPIVYQNSRYAERLPIGKPEMIEQVEPEVVKRFFSDWYRPDLMAIIAVGDFDLEQMENTIQQRFGKLQNPPQARKRKDYPIKLTNGNRFAIFSDSEMPFTEIELKYQQEGKTINTVADYQEVVKQRLYNRMLNSRMQELQRLPNPPFTFAYSGYGKDLSNLDNYTISAFVEEGGALKGLEAVYKATKRALFHGFKNTELERHQSELLSSLKKNVQEKDKINSSVWATRYIYHFLQNAPALSPEQELALNQYLMKQISLEEINVLPEKWLSSKKRVVVLTGPDKKAVPLPSSDEILALMDSIDQLDIPPFEDLIIDAPLLDTLLSPVAITKEEYNEEFKFTELQLANGIKVILKPTDYQNDEILLSAFSPGGHSIYPDSMFRSADIAAFLVKQSGLGQFDFLKLEKLLAGKRVSVAPYISELEEGFAGQSDTENLETMFQLIYLYFTKARMDEVHFQSFMRRQYNTVKNMYENPYYQFADQKTKLKYNNHPRKQTVKAENLALINMDDAFNIYKDRFQDASDFTFILVGNMDVEKVKPLLAAYLGNLPNQQRRENWRNVNANLRQGILDTTFYGGQAPKSLVEIVYHGTFDQSKSNNRYLFSSLTTLFRDRLRDRLREEKGGVYSINVRAAVQRKPVSSYRITLTFNTNPKDTEALIQLISEEVEKLQNTGATENELATIKEKQLQGRITGMQENQFWLSQLSARYKDQLGFKTLSLNQYKNLQKSLSNKNLQKAALTYLAKENYLKMVLKPAIYEFRDKE